MSAEFGQTTYGVEQLGEAAIGTIEPEPRIQRGEIDAATVKDMARRLAAGEFYVPIDDEHGPNAAGGTFTLVVADALTTGRFRDDGANATVHAKSVYEFLTDAHRNNPGLRQIIPRVCIDGRLPVAGSKPNASVIGGHDDEHGPEGCGAQKRLGDILQYIAARGNDVRQFLVDRGVEVDDGTHRTLVANSGALLASGYVRPATELRAALVEFGGAAAVTKLGSSHLEVLEAINTQPKLTLDRPGLRVEFGEAYEAFGLDVAPLEPAMGVISLTPEEAEEKFAAAMYYNVATGLVLGGPSLGTVTH